LGQTDFAIGDPYDLGTERGDAQTLPVSPLRKGPASRMRKESRIGTKNRRTRFLGFVWEKKVCHIKNCVPQMARNALQGDRENEQKRENPAEEIGINPVSDQSAPPQGGGKRGGTSSIRFSVGLLGVPIGGPEGRGSRFASSTRVRKKHLRRHKGVKKKGPLTGCPSLWGEEHRVK